MQDKTKLQASKNFLFASQLITVSLRNIPEFAISMRKNNLTVQASASRFELQLNLPPKQMKIVIFSKLEP